MACVHGKIIHATNKGKNSEALNRKKTLNKYNATGVSEIAILKFYLQWCCLCGLMLMCSKTQITLLRRHVRKDAWSSQMLGLGLGLGFMSTNL